MQNVLRAGELFLNAYQMTRLLGSGGMGQAYLGKNVHTRTPVVIKVMHAHLLGDSLCRRRFSAEADLLGHFRHPYAVALLDADPDHEEHPFLVQEYVEGLSLHELLASLGGLPISRTARIAGQLCEVLHALHARGILHRDISAANVMTVSEPTEHVKIMDFGLASLGASSGVYLALDKLAGSATSIGGGTPDYLCPEQIRKEPVDQRGDLYSLGVLLFELLTGRLPFHEARSVQEILLSHLHQPPPPFVSFGVTDVPPRVESLVRRLMAKQPAERPTGARDLAELLSNAFGFQVAAPEAFQARAETQETLEGPFAEDQDILDRFDAWMPEQIAVMKLRGFLERVEGEVLASLPGKIRVRLLDPRVKPQLRPAGLLGYLGLRRAGLCAPNYLHLELWMEKKNRDGRSMVELAVILEPGTGDAEDDVAMRRGFAERICRELRSYLMV